MLNETKLQKAAFISFTEEIFSKIDSSFIIIWQVLKEGMAGNAQAVFRNALIANSSEILVEMKRIAMFR